MSGVPTLKWLPTRLGRCLARCTSDCCPCMIEGGRVTFHSCHFGPRTSKVLRVCYFFFLFWQEILLIKFNQVPSVSELACRGGMQSSWTKCNETRGGGRAKRTCVCTAALTWTRRQATHDTPALHFFGIKQWQHALLSGPLAAACFP